MAVQVVDLGHAAGNVTIRTVVSSPLAFHAWSSEDRVLLNVWERALRSVLERHPGNGVVCYVSFCSDITSCF